MVGVGGLAALINVAILLVVAVADRAIELIVRNFATSRLLSHGKVPVVHDSDTWLPFLPRSVVKYRRHPGRFDSATMFRVYLRTTGSLTFVFLRVCFASYTLYRLVHSPSHHI